MESAVNAPVSPRLGENFASVRASIEGAVRRAGRPTDSVTLVAASKTVAPETLEEAIALGHRTFGENRVQEAVAKWPAIRERHPDVRLHLIGPLQSNKAREAVALFDVIQSLDRPSLCKALARQCAEQGRSPALFVQVNIGEEPQKAGIAPVETTAFLEACHEVYGLVISGLMCIPPAGQSPAEYFDRLAELAERNGIPALSMGMSGDYQLAIAHGATHVRVGTALFGSRT